MSSIFDDVTGTYVEVPDYSGASAAGTGDWATALLTGFNTAANVYGKVAVADIQANAKWPQYAVGGYQPGMYQVRGAAQISPMMLLLFAGLIWAVRR